MPIFEWFQQFSEDYHFYFKNRQKWFTCALYTWTHICICRKLLKEWAVVCGQNLIMPLQRKHRKSWFISSVNFCNVNTPTMVISNHVKWRDMKTKPRNTARVILSVTLLFAPVLATRNWKLFSCQHDLLTANNCPFVFKLWAKTWTPKLSGTE